MGEFTGESQHDRPESSNHARDRRRVSDHECAPYPVHVAGELHRFSLQQRQEHLEIFAHLRRGVLI
jgi:hypothetical protein